MLQYLLNLVNRTERDERGASAVEYGLLVAGIAAVVVATVFLLGGTVNSAFQSTCDSVKQSTC